MSNFEEEKIAFGKRMSALLIENGFSKFGRGALKEVLIPDHAAFALAYTLKADDKISYKSVEKWCKGEAYFETKRYPVICEMLNTTQEWIMTGKGMRLPSNATKMNTLHEPEAVEEGLGLNSSALGQPDLSQFVSVPVYDVELAAGCGGYSNGDTPLESMSLSADILSRNNVYPPDASIVRVKGHSMESTLFHGDTILVDTSVKKPINNGIFAFELEGDLRVKRFSKKLDGIWRVISDNPDKNRYCDEMISMQVAENLRILGQVVTIIERPLRDLL